MLEWKCTPLQMPPKDGSWVIVLYDDNSGAVILAWLEGEDGVMGWYGAEGSLESKDEFTPGTIWIPLFDGFVPWFEMRLQDRG